MANLNIPDHFQDRHNSLWNLAIQQSESKFKRMADYASGVDGKSLEFSFLDSMEMEEKNARFSKVNLVEPETWKRRLLPRSFKKAIAFEETDQYFLGNMSVPKPETIQSLRYANERMADRVILGVEQESLTSYVVSKGGIFGVNKGGNDGETDYNLLSSQIVPANTGFTADTTLNIEKLYSAIEILRENGVLDDENNMGDDCLCMAITPKDAIALAKEDEMKNNQYGFQILRSFGAKLDPIMGIRFMITRNLPKDSSGNYRNIMWLKNSLKFGVWKDASFKVQERADIHDTYQIVVSSTMGATRLRDEAFVQILSKH